MPVNKSDPAFQAWRSKTTDRIHTTSAGFLGLGLFTFILAICFTLFQDKLVTTILSKFPLKITSEEIVADNSIENEEKANTKYETAERAMMTDEGINAEQGD